MDTIKQTIESSLEKNVNSTENILALTTIHGKIKADQRPLSTCWMSDKLIADTQRIWSTYLARYVSEAEAIEILTNVRNFALALIIDDDEEKGKNHDDLEPLPKERCNLGARLLPRTT